jgi:hypothetical protein
MSESDSCIPALAGVFDERSRRDLIKMARGMDACPII